MPPAVGEVRKSQEKRGIKGQHYTAQSTQKTREDAKSRLIPHEHRGGEGRECGRERTREPRQHGGWSQESQQNDAKTDFPNAPPTAQSVY